MPGYFDEASRKARMEKKPRIGISACLVGEPVRYSGGHCRDDLVMRSLAPHVELVPMCPEVGAGLGAPRESLHLEGDVASPRLVSRDKRRDMTDRLTLWSRTRAQAVGALELDGFILKKGSPTCGMERVRVYPLREGAPTYEGVGIFARELMARHPLLAVEEEGRLHDAGLREHFLTRVFASRRWRDFAEETPSTADLRHFHVQNELLVRAHDEAGWRELSRLVAEPDPATGEGLRAYGAAFLRALSGRATHASEARILARLLEEVRRVSPRERQDLERMIERYGAGRLPLAVPAGILEHHLRAQDAWASAQSWFAPWPEGILLRVEITHEKMPRDGARG